MDQAVGHGAGGAGEHAASGDHCQSKGEWHQSVAGSHQGFLMPTSSSSSSGSSHCLATSEAVLPLLPAPVVSLSSTDFRQWS